MRSRMSTTESLAKTVLGFIVLAWIWLAGETQDDYVLVLAIAYGTVWSTWTINRFCGADWRSPWSY